MVLLTYKTIDHDREIEHDCNTIEEAKEYLDQLADLCEWWDITDASGTVLSSS